MGAVETGIGWDASHLALGAAARFALSTRCLAIGIEGNRRAFIDRVGLRSEVGSEKGSARGEGSSTGPQGGDDGAYWAPLLLLRG